MSIIQKLLGGPGYFMEADEETLAKIEASIPAKPAPVQPAPVEQPPAPVVSEPVVEEPTAEVVTEQASDEAPEVTETAPVVEADTSPQETVRQRKKRATTARQDSTGAASAVPVSVGVSDIQALVDAAIAEVSAQTQAEASAPKQTFATDCLLAPTMKGRRRPGPSLTGFMDMAGSMKRR